MRRGFPCFRPGRLLAGLLLGTTALHAAIGTQLTAPERQSLQREARTVIGLVQNFHYADRSLHEIDGKEVITTFLNRLDPHGYILSRADGDFLRSRFGRSLKSVYLLKGDLQPAFEIYDLFAARARERVAWIERRLDAGVPLEGGDAWDPALDDEPPADAAESDRRWELRLRAHLIRERVAGRDHAAAVAEVRDAYRRWQRESASLDVLAVRELFFDGLLSLFDPHSGYFSADSAREFAVEMDGAVVGVGLELRKENGRCIVDTILAGGPADRAGSIHPGDELLAYADGDQPWVETSAKRLREIVAATRGDAGTRVRLAFRGADGAGRREIVLERARVVLAEERASGGVAAVPDADGRSRRIGWIELPAFYAATDDAGATSSSAAADLRELLVQMDPARLDGLVIDLRANPGGALPEAVAVSGLFLPSGPVLLTRDLAGTVTTHAVRDTTPVYTGPLVVLTSARSASASEIFAGAMQFHRRGLVVGAPTTFGKGTVQNFLDLARAINGAGDTANWGVLRLTAQRFYLPDGSAVQCRGAASDIVLPGADPAGDTREESLPHALPAETIAPPAGTAPADGVFARVTPALVERLRAGLAARHPGLPEFEWHRRRVDLEARAARPRAVPLDLARAQVENTADEEQARTLRRDYRRLLAECAFPAEAVRLASVTAAARAHEELVRTQPLPDGAPRLGRLVGDRFYGERSDGRVVELALPDVNFARLDDEADALAAAYAGASGRATTADEIRAGFRALRLARDPAEGDILRCLAPAAAPPEAAAHRRGVEALLQAATRVLERPALALADLDVPLREAARLAADWSAALPATATVSP